MCVIFYIVDDIPQERTIAVYQEENLTVFNETYSIWPCELLC